MRNSLLFLLLLISITYSCEFVDPQGGGVIIDGINSFTVSVTPCEHGTDVNVEDLPQAIQDYLNQEFPDASIDNIELFQDDETSTFGVRLGNGMEILFNADGVVIRSSDDNSEREISLEDLLGGITDFIAANYPDLLVDHAETELEYGHTYIEIYLTDGTQLYFDLEGNFLCQDDHGSDDTDWDDHSDNGGDDNDDDDDDHHSGNAPAIIQDFITANYPDYHFDELEKEDLCNDVEVYKIELERENEQNEPELYFDLDGNFLFVSVDINVSDLPAEVIATIEATYPGYQIINDKVDRHEYPDGSAQYEVKIKGSGDDSNKELIFSADGTMLCED